MSGTLVEGIGQCAWWGLSPAKDLAKDCLEKQGPLRVLCVGAADVRHILKTMCSGRKVEFYVMETNLEQYARIMLLLSVALQPASCMGLQEKTELYLDLLGNSMLRGPSVKFLKRAADTFIKMVTDEGYQREVLPMLDLTAMKFKERDFLEGIFKFWMGDFPYEMDKLWDDRVRRFMGVRYDAGRNAFDYDYSMKLKERAVLIEFNEYALWRRMGVAYEVRDGVYDTPNRSLCSGVIVMRNGAKTLCRGYWGDITCSPYITHGVKCDLSSMYEVRNRIQVRTGSEVAEYNVMCIVHTLLTGTEYTEPPKPDRFSFNGDTKKATLDEVIEEEEEEEEEEVEKVEVKETRPNKKKKDYIQLTQPHNKDVTVKLLPLGTMDALPNKTHLQKTFDLMYLGASQVGHLTPNMTTLLKEDARIVVENVKYVVPLMSVNEEQYIPKVLKLAEEAKCAVDGKPKIMDDFITFTYHRVDPS